MSRNRSLGTLGVVLIVAIVIVLSVPGAWAVGKYKTLHRFKGHKDGSLPQAGVIFDNAGNLYGTTLEGGAHGYGTVFKLASSAGGGRSQTVLHSFNNNGHDGVSSYARLVFDGKGHLYGTTYYGGTGACSSGQFPGCGTVFQLSQNSQGGWNYKVIYSFKAGADGAWPASELTLDSEGSLYGTTASGGTGGCNVGGYVGCGTVFGLTPSNGSWTETVLHSFGGGIDGEFLYGGVVRDTAGNLYGTTEEGGNTGCYGNYGCGTIFKLALSGGVWTKTLLYMFSGGGDGAWPDGTPVLDVAGNLYGVTLFGGRKGAGTVFELLPSSTGWTETVVHNFCSRSNCYDGDLPFAGLVSDQAGALYGAARDGGAAGYGVVFKLTQNSNGGWKETVLHSFLDHPGASSYAGMIFDATGNLYGTTAGDNSTTFGSVFEITP